MTDVSKQHIGSLFIAAELLCSFAVLTKKEKSTDIGSDLLCGMSMHFSRVTLKTPCSSSLKRNLTLPGLKVHVKLKATHGVGMKN